MLRSLSEKPNETWEIAAERTLQLYKKTKPSFNELSRATEKIQAAYRGYYIRRNLLRHLKPKKKKKPGPKVELPGPPLDIAASREIDLGPVINVKIREDDVSALFDEAATEKLGLRYHPMKTITHLENEKELMEDQMALAEARRAQKESRTKTRRGPRFSETEISTEVEETITTEAQERIDSDVVPATLDAALHKISFSEVPPEVIPDEVEDIQDVPEDTPAETVSEAADAYVEAESEAMQEVPEDIPERSEGDGESVPTASVPSSAPDTANTTDVEDAGEDLDTGEEEGEE